MTNEQVPANFSLPSLSTPGSEAYAQRTRLDQFLFHISSHSLMLPDIEITLGAYLFRSTYQVLCAVTHLFFGEDDPAMSYVKGRYGDHPIRAQFSRGRWIGLLKCLLGNQVWAEFTNAQEFQPPERLILQFTEDDMKGKYPIAQQHQRDPQPGSRCSFPELCFAAKQQPPPSLSTLAISFDRYIIDPRSKVARTAISWLSKGTLFVHVKGLRTATPSELGPPIGFVSVSPIRGGGHDVVMFIGPYDFLGLDGLLKEVLQCKELGERALERLKQKEEVDYDLCDHDGEVDSRDLDSGEVKVSGAFLDGLSRYVKEMPKYYDERIYQICQRYSVSGFYEAIRPSKGESARAELDTRLYVSHSRPLHQKSIEMLRAIKESSMSAISGDVKQPSILKQIQSSSEPIILYPFENLLNTSKEDLVPVVRWLQRHFEDEVFGQGTEREPNLSLETESPSEQMAIHNESDGDMVVGADDAPLARERVSGGDVVDLMDVDEGTISVRDIQCLTGDDHNNYVPDFERVVIKSSKVQESVRQRLIVAFQSLTESWSSTSFNFVNNELVAMSKLHSAELDEDFLANICEVFLRLCHRVDVFKRFLVPKSVQQMALSYRRKGLADRLGEIQRKCFEELQGRFNARIESQVPG